MSGTVDEYQNAYISIYSFPVQRQMRELMVRAMYCEMLGYEASFTYIHAIKLAQQGTVLEKRVGMLHTLTLIRMLDDI